MDELLVVQPTTGNIDHH